MGDIIWIVFILIAIVNVFSSRKKKQQEEAKRRAAAAAQEATRSEEEETPAYGTPARSTQADPRFPELDGGYVYAAKEADPRFPDYMPEAQQASDAQRVRQKESERALAEAKYAARVRLMQQERQQREEQARIEQKRPMTARVGSTLQAPMQSRLEDPLGRQHTLEPSFISGHAHTESSITGIQEDCPPPRTAARAKVDRPAQVQPHQQAPDTPTADMLGRLVRSRNALVQGMLMSEVLGKPKALRR